MQFFLEVHKPSGEYLYVFRTDARDTADLKRESRQLLAAEPVGSYVQVLWQDEPFTPWSPAMHVTSERCTRQ